MVISPDSSALGEIPGYDPKRDAGDCVFDPKSAALALDFFPTCLNHVEGELGKRPFELSAWERPIIGNLFGWKRPDGTRRYRTAFIEVGGKNGKTPLAAGIGTYLYHGDGEPGAQIINVAYTKEQALLLWRWTRGFAELDASLSARVKIFKAGHSMVLKADEASFFRTIAFEERGAHGYNLHAAIVDELHAISDSEAFRILKTRFISRRQPLLVMITTAGWDRESVCFKEYEYACRVRDGVEGYLDASYLPVIYEAKPEDCWTAEATWAKANPNLGISVNLDALRAECEVAKKSPSDENTFKRLHLNLWTEQSVRYYPMDRWDACQPRRKLEDLEGELCYAGLDLAQKKDLAGLTLVFPDEEDEGAFDVFTWAWIPEATAREHEKTDRVPYREWARAGLVELTPGDAIDHRYIAERIVELSKRFDMPQLGFDEAGATQLVLWAGLADEHGVECVAVPQTWNHLSEPMNLSLVALQTGKLRHGDNPLLRWQFSNTAAQPSKFNPQSVRPYKARKTGRIDNVVALIMALSRVIKREASDSFVYDRRPVRSL